jgi:hypothetical protein
VDSVLDVDVTVIEESDNPIQGEEPDLNLYVADVVSPGLDGSKQVIESCEFASTDSVKAVCADVDCTLVCAAAAADNNESESVLESVPVAGLGVSKPATSESVKAEQTDDSSLNECKQLANVQKGGFKWRDGLLFHSDQVLGQTVEQFCVPKGRRGQVLELAHDQCGGHLASKRTSERIRFSFFWPGMKRDVEEYCKSCPDCQRRSRVMVADRVPIQPICRAQYPGQHLFLDVIGPIEPPASNYKYCLCVIDSCSRWPWVY